MVGPLLTVLDQKISSWLHGSGPDSELYLPSSRPHSRSDQYDPIFAYIDDILDKHPNTTGSTTGGTTRVARQSDFDYWPKQHSGFGYQGSNGTSSFNGKSGERSQLSQKRKRTEDDYSGDAEDSSGVDSFKRPHVFSDNTPRLECPAYLKVRKENRDKHACSKYKFETEHEMWYVLSYKLGCRFILYLTII